jgi:O-antigen ligase
MRGREVILLLAMFSGSLLIEVRLPEIGFSAANLCVPLGAVALAWMRRDCLVDALARHRFLLAAALVLYAWAWISALQGDEPALSVRYALKYAAHFVVFAALLVFFCRRGTAEAAERIAYGFLVVLGVLGVAEHWFPQSPLFTFFRQPPGAQPRVASLMIWPNQFAVLIAIAVTWGAALLHRRRIAAFGYYAATPFLLLALALSGSRSGWVVLGTVSTVLTLAHVMTVKQAAAIAAVFALALTTFRVPTAQLGLTGVGGLPLESAFGTGDGKPPPGTAPPRVSVAARFELWRAAIEQLERRPVSGIGLEVFANRIGPRVTQQYWINTHNLLLNIAVELGLVGAALFVVFAGVLLFSGDPREWTATIPLLGAGIGQVFDCFTYDHAFMAFAVFFAASYASRPPAEAATILQPPSRPS